MVKQEFRAQDIIPDSESVVTVTWLGWGDEWKGKVAAALHGWYDIVAAANGGGNAGHNVIIREWLEGEKKLHFHELPGAAVSGVPTYISWGRVMNVTKLWEEILTLERETSQRVDIILSTSTQIIITSLQQKLDGDIERDLSAWWCSVGTTKKWIGPAYALKAFRLWINVGQLLYDDEWISKKIDAISSIFSSMDREAIMWEFLLAKQELQTLIDAWTVTLDDSNTFIPESISKDWKKVIIECSQSVMLSLSGNAYPNCTSSECWFNGIAPSLGLPWAGFKVWVIKAIPSKVWNGTFPTKFDTAWVDWDFIHSYRQKAWEFGATTGRPRDVWFLDAVQIRHVFKTGNTPDVLWINMVDLLLFLQENGIKNKIAIGYRAINKKTKEEKYFTDTVPPDFFEILAVEYIDLPDVGSEGDYQKYVHIIRSIIWFTWPIVIGTGPWSRDNILFKC